MTLTEPTIADDEHIGADGDVVDETFAGEASADMERLVGIGAAWKLIGQAGVQGIRLVTVAILANLLRPDDYGAAAIVVTFAAFAPTVADMGMGSALVQSKTSSRVERSTVFWASLGSGVILSLLAVAAASPVAHFLGDSRVGPIVAVGGLVFAICAAGNTTRWVLMRELRFREVELRYWFALVVASVAAIAAAAGGAGPWALVLQQLVSFAVLGVALFWRVDWRPTWEFSGQELRRTASFAIRIAGGRWARLAELLVLSLLIGKLAGLEELGVWVFAMNTVIVPLTLIAIPIAEVLFSAFSRLQDERERIAALWLSSLRLLAAAVMPLMVGLVVVAPDVVPVVFGDHWKESVGVVQILSVWVLIRCLQSWNSIVLDAAGRPQITFWTQFGALCLAPLAVVVGSRWNIEAVALCFVGAQLIAVEVPSLIFVLAELRVSLRSVLARLSAVALANAVMAAACLLGRTVLVDAGLGMGPRAAITIALGGLVYAAAIRLFAPDVAADALGLWRRILAKVVPGRPLGRRRARAQADAG